MMIRQRDESHDLVYMYYHSSWLHPSLIGPADPSPSLPIHPFQKRDPLSSLPPDWLPPVADSAASPRGYASYSMYARADLMNPRLLRNPMRTPHSLRCSGRMRAHIDTCQNKRLLLLNQILFPYRRGETNILLPLANQCEFYVNLIRMLPAGARGNLDLDITKASVALHGPPTIHLSHRI